jgi:repressor LexA
MDGLTNRQEQILQFIHDFTRVQKRPPAVREIGDGVGLRSPCTVYRHLESLEKFGFIRRDRNKARSIEIIDRDRFPEEVVELPIVGQIAAGQPILAEENIEGTLPVAQYLLGHGEHFVLRVKGDSMIEDGIFDGDYVVLRRQETAEENDIVAAFTPYDQDGTATLKRLHYDNGRIWLRPANSTMPSIYVTARDEMRVLGKAVLSLRML